MQKAVKGFDRYEVDPHQFLGIEINKRARHIAELVLWLGYLQWHMAALAVAPEAVTAGELAQNFKQGKKAEARIAATLSSLARTGFISALDGGKRFSSRRVA